MLASPPPLAPSIDPAARKLLRHRFSYIALTMGLCIVLLGICVLPLFPMLVLQLLQNPLGQDLGFLQLAGSVLLYVVGVPLFWLCLRHLPDSPPPPSFARVRPRTVCLFALVSLGVVMPLAMATDSLMAWVEGLLHRPLSDPLAAIFAQGSLWMVLVPTMLGAPIFEELVCRWFLYKKLAGFGAWPFMLFSGLLFGLFHCNVFQFFYAFALGVLFAAVLYATGKLWLPMLLHFVVNASSGITLLLQHYVSERAASVAELSIYLLATLGLFLGVLALLFERSPKGFRFAPHLPRFVPAQYPLPQKRLVVWNLGVVLFALLSLVLAAVNLFAPTA